MVAPAALELVSMDAGVNRSDFSSGGVVSSPPEAKPLKRVPAATAARSPVFRIACILPSERDGLAERIGGAIDYHRSRGRQGAMRRDGERWRGRGAGVREAIIAPAGQYGLTLGGLLVAGYVLRRKRERGQAVIANKRCRGRRPADRGGCDHLSPGRRVGKTGHSRP